MNYNKSGLITLLASVFFSFAWFVWLMVSPPIADLAEIEGTSSPSASEESEKEEETTASEDPSAPSKVWVYSDFWIKKGAKVYQTHCSACHGPKGIGDGPAAQALVPPPRNLVKGGWEKGGDSISLFNTLNKGIEGTSMVSFSYLSKEDRWALVHYVRSITKDKPKDDLKKLEEFAQTAK